MKRSKGAIIFPLLSLTLWFGCGKSEPVSEPTQEPAATPAKPAPVPERARPVEKKEPTLDLGAYGKTPLVEVHTSLGLIVMELDAEKAPKTVRTILSYVEDGFYDGTVFHRIKPEFVIQGGGKRPGPDGVLENKPVTYHPIPSEVKNGLTHVRGAVALARGKDPDSGTCQFYVSLKDNPSLDGISKGKFVRSKAYTVFGKVIEGMDVVDKIAAVEVVDPDKGVPAQAPVITKIRVRKE